MTMTSTLSGIEDVFKECGVTEATLSPEERESLDRLGYVVLSDVIDSGWLTRLRTAFERAVDQKQTTTNSKQTGTRHAGELIQKDEAFDGVLTHPKILAATYHVLRRSFKVLALGGRDPLPGYGQQALHTDWYPRVSSSEPFSAATTLWLLDDFIENNGATRLIPGSHLWLKPLPKPMQQPHARHPRAFNDGRPIHPRLLERIAIACTGRLTGSVPRAVASGLQAKTRSLPLAVLIRTVISVCRTLICNPL